MNAHSNESESTSSAPVGLREKWANARKSRWFRWSVDILLFLVVLAGFSAWQARDLINKNEPAPQFSLTDMEGDLHSLSDYEGARTFVVFWAPWCAVCGAESDNVGRVKRMLGDRLNVISVVLDFQNRESIREFMDEQNVDYPVLIGTDEVRDGYNISAFPSIYVINADGTIRRATVGYTSTIGMLWRAVF